MIIIKWIGIITIACIGGQNPCNKPPYGLGIYIPDGISTHQPCLSAEVTPTHNAYIRVRTTIPSFHWPGRAACTHGSPCWLFPLHKHDVIRVNGVIDGNGMSAPFTPNPIIQWSTWVPDKLANDVIQRSFATMLVTNGSVVTDALPNGMIITKGTFPVSGSTVRITISGTNRYIVVPTNTTIDILNLPRNVAVGNVEEIDHHPDFKHFYLHYELAAQKPMTCDGPKPETVNDDDDLVGSIACSNSIYP